MALYEIESILQYEKGTDSVWNNTTIPIPNKVMIYAIDTKTIKVGNGYTLYKDLPTLFNLAEATSCQNFVDQFPDLSVDDAGSIIYVGDDSTYHLSDIKIENIVSQNEMLDTLNMYSDVNHIHPELYTPDELVDHIHGGVYSKDDDIISYLAMRELETTKFDNATIGYLDNFTDLDHIESISESVVYHEDTDTLEGSGEIVSSTNTSTNPITEVGVTLRGEFDSHINNYDIEVSRDGGTTWRTVPKHKPDLSIGNIDILASKCQFDLLSAEQSITPTEDMITDCKGSITTFTVDTENTSGHFDTSISETITPGCIIYLDGGMQLNIKTIDSDGTNVDAVTIINDISLGTYTVEKIVNSQLSLVECGELGNVEYKTSMPIAVRGHTATLYQDKIYVIGGYDGTTCFNTTYIYDIANDTWSQGTNLSTSIYIHTATLYEDKIYVIGGHNGSASLDTTYIYDIINDTWSTGANIPQRIHYHTATLYQDKIYVIGGSRTESTTNTIYIYDIINNTWSNISSILPITYYHTATLYQDKIYVIGGLNSTFTSHYKTVYIYDISNNTWSTGANVPIAISQHTAILYQDKIYVMGGYDGTTHINTTYIYDISTNLWNISTNVSSIRLHTATLYQDKIYVIGGYNGTSNYNTTYTYSLPKSTPAIVPTTVEYDTGTLGDIENKANAPIGMHSYTATLYQDKIYVIGGVFRTDGVNLIDRIRIYDISTNTWSNGSLLPTRIRDHTATLYQDKIYVIGGYRLDPFKTVYIYDISNNTWSTGANVPIAISQHTATLYQDKIYVIGGYDGTTHINTTYIYDITNNTWSTGRNIPIAIYQHTATLYQDKIYVMGGYSTTYLNTTYIYDITNNTWSTGANIPIAVRAHTATLYQGKIYVIGGQNGPLLNTTYIYDITNNTWSQGANMPIAVRDHTATLYQDKIYVIGGSNDDTPYLNTIYAYSLITHHQIPTIPITNISIELDTTTGILDSIHKDSTLCYIFRFNDTFKVYKNDQWYDVIRYNVDHYEYLNDQETWDVANSLNSALSIVSDNTNTYMSMEELITLYAEQFDEQPTELYIINGVYPFDIIGNNILDAADGQDFKWRLITKNNATIKLHSVRAKW
jgi:N-acetylneuraminic acid mutarotase